MISLSGVSKNVSSKRLAGGRPERNICSNLVKKQTSRINSLISLLLLLNCFKLFIAAINLFSIFDSIDGCFFKTRDKTLNPPSAVKFV